MNQHRYILEPYKGMSTRYHCSECKQRKKTFSRYIDTETGEHLADHVGRCNRESNCGYHYTPKQYFEDNKHLFDTHYPKQYTKQKRSITPPPKLISFIPVEVFEQSLTGYEANNFVKFLENLFNQHGEGAEITKQLIETYFIGTSKYWNGATTFWQIDISGKVRTGKIMLYNTSTGKRVKKPYNHIHWTHSVLKLPEFNLQQCFFGEHLLQDKTKPVAIVESEKTAIIASIYLPQFIWLGAGGKDGLNAEKCKVLSGRKVTLYPDLNGFEKWNNKSKEFSHIAHFKISELLEKKATDTERQQGLDLADYLTRFDYRDFQQPQHTEPQQQVIEQIPITKALIESKETPSVKILPSQKEIETITEIAENWDKEIAELQTFFETATLPSEPITLNSSFKDIEAEQFIETNINIVKMNNGNNNYYPNLLRLKQLKTILSK